MQRRVRAERRTAARSWGAAVVALLLAGCVNLPTSGPVVSGNPARPPEVRALADLPRTDAPPIEIVRGFLRASSATSGRSDTPEDEDYQVARAYLTPEAASGWDPAQATVVYAGGLPSAQAVAGGTEVPGDLAAATSATVRVPMSVIGSIDERGRYSGEPGSGEQMEFPLVRSDPQAQWRISQVKDATLVPEQLFRTLYTPLNLYYLDPGNTELVPELRWFRRTGSTATRLITELLRGPSDWLAPAVRTAFPPTTALTLPQAVTTVRSEVRVPLGATATLANDADRARMAIQIETTLRPLLGSAEQIRVQAGGDDLTFAPLPADQRPQLDRTVVSAPVVLAGTRLRSVVAGQLVELPGVGEVDASAVHDPALGYDRSVAVLTAERSELRFVGTDGLGPPMLSAPALTAPSFDRGGWVWTTPRGADGYVRAVRRDSQPVLIEAPWLRGRTVLSLRVAQDGARVALVSTGDDAQTRLDLSAVVRDDGRPVSLGDPATVLRGDFSDAGWVNRGELAVLGRLNEKDGVFLVPAGPGPPLASTSPAFLELDVPANRIAAPNGSTTGRGGGLRAVLVGTRDQVLVRSGAVWADLLPGEPLREPAFPG